MNARPALARDALDFDPASSLLAVCTPEEQVRFIDLASRQELPPLRPGGPPAVAVFDLAGTRLAVASGKSVHIYGYPAQELVRTIEVPERVLDLDRHPDGAYLAGACSDGRVLLIAVSGESTLVLRGHTDLVSQAFFDPAGAVLVSTSWDGTTRFWAAGSGAPLFVNHSGFARQFDRTGTRLFYHREGTGLGEWKFIPARGLQTLAAPLDSSWAIAAMRRSWSTCTGSPTSGRRPPPWHCGTVAPGTR